MTTHPTPSSDGPLDREPVLILLAAAAAIIDAGLLAANALEWTHLTGEQIAAVVAFVTVTTAAAAATIRAKVYAPATVNRITRINDAGAL